MHQIAHLRDSLAHLAEQGQLLYDNLEDVHHILFRFQSTLSLAQANGGHLCCLNSCYRAIFDASGGNTHCLDFAKIQNHADPIVAELGPMRTKETRKVSPGFTPYGLAK